MEFKYNEHGEIISVTYNLDGVEKTIEKESVLKEPEENLSFEEMVDKLDKIFENSNYYKDYYEEPKTILILNELINNI